MTTIACWFNREQNTSVWMCGDSKLTNNETMLTESAAKIFALPIQVHTPSNSGFFDKLIYSNTIGLAYAGSSIVGLNTYAASATCLLNLNSTNGDPPALVHVAKYVMGIAKKYIDQLSFNAGRKAFTEFLLTGFCPNKKDFCIFHIYPQEYENSWEYEIKEYYASTTPNEFVALLGGDRERIRERIIEYRKRLKSPWRVPLSVIYDEVESPVNPTIGGSLQLGICTANGFGIYSVTLPTKTPPIAMMNFLGFDVSNDFFEIGNCFVGMPSMYIGKLSHLPKSEEAS